MTNELSAQWWLLVSAAALNLVSGIYLAYRRESRMAKAVRDAEVDGPDHP